MLKSLSNNILNQLTGRMSIIMGDKAPMNFEKSLFGDYEKYWPYLGGHIDTHFLKFPMHPLTGLSPKMVWGEIFF